MLRLECGVLCPFFWIKTGYIPDFYDVIVRNERHFLVGEKVIKREGKEHRKFNESCI